MSSLKKRTISGVFWSLLQNVSSEAISVIISIVLARLLMPKDFGLVGMLSVFIAVSNVFVNGGFSQALIQKKDADEVDFSSVFFINLVVSLLFYAILYLSSPLIAKFYKQPILELMMQVLGLVVIISAFSQVQNARLTKALRFKTLMAIQLPSLIFSGLIGIFLAWRGFGVWSIVWQQVAMRFIYTVQLWIYSKWTPKFVFDTQRLKSMFSYGGNLMLASFINRIFENLYSIIIGKFFSAQTLGYYQNANGLQKKPTQVIAHSIKNVTFPSLSIIQDDNKKLKSAYKKSIVQVLFWIIPVITISAVLAQPLFSFVLTEKWLPSVPYFQILAISSIFTPVSIFNLDIIKVKGHARLYLRIQVLKKIITVIGIAITLPFGIWPLVIFQPFNAFINYFINAYFSGKAISYSIKEQLTDILPVVFLGLLTGGVVLLFDKLLLVNTHDLVRLILGTLIGIFVYFGVSIFFKMELIEDFKDIGRQLINKE